MRSSIALLAVALLVGCGAEDTRDAEGEAAAQLEEARAVVAAEIDRDVAATEKALGDLSASLRALDQDIADLYHDALDESGDVLDSAKSEWEKAGQAADEAWQDLGAETRKATAEVQRETRRLAALTGEVKDDFVREADDVLDEVRADFEKLNAKAANLDEDARKSWDEFAAKAEQEYDAAEKALDQAKDDTGEAWKDTRHDVNRNLLDLKAKIREAKRELTD